MNPSPTTAETLNVSQLNRQAKRLLESHFGYVWVEGELTNLATPASGHWYFSLKDASSQVRCAMFKGNNQRLRFRPGNGEQVRIRARVSLYEGRGEFQLIAEFMEPAGAGALQRAYELLKQQLEAEGLFDRERKQTLPQLPRHIGVITSPTGAAIRDVLSVFKRRFAGINISIIAVPVQGEDAAPAIVQALTLAQDRSGSTSKLPFDALLLTRGGGSMEDLWAFNDERVVRAIAGTEIPIVSAVGHEIDFTLSDFAADARAPTPSAAAELMSPDGSELVIDFKNLELSLHRSLRLHLIECRSHLTQVSKRLRHPGDRLQDHAQRLDELTVRLQRAQRVQFTRAKQQLMLLRSRLLGQPPAQQLRELGLRLTQNQQQLHHQIERILQDQRTRIGTLATQLHAISPLATLDRGYALVQSEQGEVITETAGLAVGQRVTTRLSNGQFDSQVVSVEPTEAVNTND